MRKILYTLVLSAFAAPLFASDARVGTWKLDPDKSVYKVGSAPKNVTIVISTEGATLQETITGSAMDGSPINVAFTVPVKGGSGSVQKGDFDGVSVKQVSSHVWETHYMRGGKELRAVRLVVSPDGKTMRSNMKGVNSAGQQVDGTALYQKQD